MNSPVWLVTGASSGVGRVLAVALAAAGRRVLLAARRPEALADTAQWCQGRGEPLAVDLADPASVDDLAARVIQRLEGRPLAGIVHAAGIMAWDSPATASGWSRVPLVNAVAPARLIKALEGPLTAQPGNRVLLVAGAPFTLKGVVPRPEAWKGEAKGKGMGLALEAAAAKVALAGFWHRRWGGRTSIFAFHPGFVKSNLADGLPFPLRTLGCLAQPFLSTRCATGEFLALDTAAPALSGQLVDGRRAVALDVPLWTGFPELV